jgi:N-acetyl-gamma-glutamyl-phosphate reductase
MLNVGIVGASGYTGVELARIISTHPHARLTVATSRQYAGSPLSKTFPSLKGVADIVCEDIKGEQLAEKADFFFTAVPHQTAMGIIPSLLESGKKVVDLSADFRISNPDTYEQWYQPHTAKNYLSEAVYGLCELKREEIKKARLIANPGCYPTSVILGLAPLLENNLIDPGTIIIDSKSGTSGAGRAAATGTLFCEVADGFRAYKVGEHRHTPEIEQEISIIAGRDVIVSFTPHLVPMSRGILSTIYCRVNESSSGLIEKAYQDRYLEEHFVRFLSDSLPATQYVRGSNFCDIAYKYDPRTNRIIIISVIDNLVKGAAGQAVQNMNLVNGFPENSGIENAPFFP